MNLLEPVGQFGTRLHGGKDSASPRYIFTMLRYCFITSPFGYPVTVVVVTVCLLAVI